MSEAHTDEPRIYVACLAAYNSGILHGEWIDAVQSVEDIRRGIRAMLKASPVEESEEWAIHAYEGFGSLRLSEYEGAERIQALARFIHEHENPTLATAVLDHFDANLEDAAKAMENYWGCYKSLADFVEEITDNGLEIPHQIAFYIDYDRMAGDMELNGDFFTITTSFDEVHVFDPV